MPLKLIFLDFGVNQCTFLLLGGDFHNKNIDTEVKTVFMCRVSFIATAQNYDTTGFLAI